MGFPDWLIWCFAHGKEIIYSLLIAFVVGFITLTVWFWRKDGES